MSSHQNKYAKTIFERFAALYGKQKTQAMFGVNAEDIAKAAEAWEEHLRATDPAIIRAVLASLVTARRDWPPSLSEWIGLCQDQNRPEHRPAALPPPSAPTEVGREISQTLSTAMQKDGFDYLFWAKHPGSVYAVRLLARGAKEDRRLRNILDHLIATDGKDCRREDALREILRMKKEHEILQGAHQ